MPRALAYTLFILCLLVCACAGYRNLTSLHIVQGRIIVIGNAPFTRLAVEDEKGMVYQLNCPKRMEQKLLQFQGERIRVFYSQMVRTKQFNWIDVERYERFKVNDNKHGG